ncbi:MFS transporter [Xylocopilactobacillus apicola]|uniref:MFS transporter n=1 Tax=Xylocopilactobacillus apicola TaxID=2932184 RepID=A0AAU9DGK4_9LACO|nr:MFS transporter [Xylocopilactobacillus apicola]BDR59085.1 MFS transporter [Xylocopilactobacillus apicola]
MFSFLKPAPDAKVKVAPDKVANTYKWRQIGVLVSILLGYAGYTVIRQVFTIQQHDIMKVYHFSTGQIGMILSCFGLGYGISKLFMGALSDKSDSNRYLATGLFLSSLINFAFGATRNFYIMCFLMLIMSIAQGMGAGACQRIIQLWWSKKRRGIVFAVWGTSKSFGAILCVSLVQLAAYLFSNSISMVFYATGVVGVVMSLIVWFAGCDRPAAVGLPSITEYAHEEVVLDNGEKNNNELTKMNIFQIITHYIINNKLVWAVTLTSMCLYVVSYGINTWIPSYLTQFKGFSPTTAKWLVGIVGVATIPGGIISGVLSDLFKNRRAAVCVVGILGVIACLIPYLLSTNHTVIIVVLILMMNFLSAPIMLVGLIINEVVPKFAVGTSTGFMGFFQYLGGEIAATALVGLLVDKYGWGANITVLFVASALALCLSIYIMITERKLDRS